MPMKKPTATPKQVAKNATHVKATGKLATPENPATKAPKTSKRKVK